MRNAFFALLAVGLLMGVSGCKSSPVGRFPGGLFGGCNDCPNTCRGVHGCRDGGCGLAGRGRNVDPVPPSGVVTYPYYTTRGPRDFLATNPRAIGP